MSPFINLSEYIAQCRKEYPHIRPLEEEEDIEWWNEGLDLIKAGELDAAERTFKKLLLAQPDISDGYNGLGMVYEKRREQDNAELFMREALTKAEGMVQKGFMDAEMLEVIRCDLNRVLKM